MPNRLSILVLCAACLAGTALPQSSEDRAAMTQLLQRAGQNDVHAQSELCQNYGQGLRVQKDIPEALRWCRKAAEKGDGNARWMLAQIYFNGDGVQRDFAEAARWFGCPKPSETVLAQCRETSYEHLPKEALTLLRRMHCRVGSNYDSGSAMTLAENGEAAYEMCCHDAPHGPCGAVLIGKVQGAWKDLTPPEGLLGFDGACNGFIVLDARHQACHDICLPVECASGTGGPSCTPKILQFENGRYSGAKPNALKLQP